MYLFYIDESGSRDASIQGIKSDGTRLSKDWLYVIVAVSLFDYRWRNFCGEIDHRKRELLDAIRGRSGPRLDLADCEIKSNWVRIPKERLRRPFLANLTDQELVDLIELYYRQIECHNMNIFAVVLDKRHFYPYMDSDKMHRKGWELLLERIETFLLQEHSKHQGIMIADDNNLRANRSLAMKHAYFLEAGTSSGSRLNHIIEMPLFVRSELSNGVQLADLIAYNVYRAFKTIDLDNPFFNRILKNIWGSKLSPAEKLDGIKIFPPESPLFELAKQAGKKRAQLVKQTGPFF